MALEHRMIPTMASILDESRFAGTRCLVTGGLGFLGSNIAVRLAEAGARVTVVDAMIPEYGGNLANIETCLDHIDVNYSDIRDRNSMDYLVRGHDYVFHAAGQVSHVMSLTDPFPDIDINVTGTTVLLEALRHHNRDAKVVYASTRGTYGPVTQLPVDEDRPSRPIAMHEISKLAAELIFQAYTQHGIASTVLRFTNTYGPRSQMLHGKYGVVNYFIRLAMDGETIKVFGDGSVLRDYVYVDDAVDAALLAALAQPTDGACPVYNVGRPEPTSIKELVQAIIAAAGNGSWELAPYSAERKAQEPGDFYSDITRIKRELGWSPSVSLADGLRRTVDYYQARGDAYWPRTEAMVQR